MRQSPNLRKLVQPHVDNLNHLFNRTVSKSRLDSQTYQDNPDFHQIARRVAGQLENIELSSGQLEFSQIITERDGRPHVVTAVYIYWLDPAKWVFRYEYATNPPAGNPHSHLHVNGKNKYITDLERIHFPAGRLSVEHLIYHLVTEYGVSCRLEQPVLINELGDSYRTWQRTDGSLFP